MNVSSQDIATAFHEAGHAVVALALGRPVQRVSVLPNQQRQGYCQLKKGRFRPSQDALETEILILLGGLAAERRRMGQFSRQGAGQDLLSMRSLTSMRAGNERQIERLERRMLAKTEHLLDQPGMWSAVQLIADALLRSTTISGRAARHLFDQAAARANDERS